MNKYLTNNGIWLSIRPLLSFYDRASSIPSWKSVLTWWNLKKMSQSQDLKKGKILLLGHNLQRFGKESDGAVIISYFMFLASSAFLDVHSEYLIPPLDAPWLAPPVQQSRRVKWCRNYIFKADSSDKHQKNSCVLKWEYFGRSRYSLLIEGKMNRPPTCHWLWKGDRSSERDKHIQVF